MRKVTCTYDERTVKRCARKPAARKGSPPNRAIYQDQQARIIIVSPENKYALPPPIPFREFSRPARLNSARRNSPAFFSVTRLRRGSVWRNGEIFTEKSASRQEITH